MSKIIASFGADESVVSMLSFNGRIFVSTTRHIYEVIDDKLVPLQVDMSVATEPTPPNKVTE